MSPFTPWAWATIIVWCRNRGKEWREMVAGGNRYRAVELGRQENAEFYFRKLISPPASSLACLDFRFRKE